MEVIRMGYEKVCDAAARARNDITEWLRQFDTPETAAVTDMKGRKAVVEGLTEMMHDLTSVLRRYVTTAD
jgi:hypothetical protein